MNFPLELTSFLLFSGAVYLYRKSGFSKTSALIFTALVIVIAALTLLHQISDSFTGDGITDATLYHIQYGLDGVNLYWYGRLLTASLVSIAATLIFLYWILTGVYRSKIEVQARTYFAFALLAASLLFHPAVSDFYQVFAHSYTGALVLPLKNTSPEGLMSSDSFQDFYKEPSIEAVGEKRNLVFIYAEGLEQTFSDEDLFPGLTPGLNSLKEKSIHFTDLRPAYRSGYTIAGMVASQCGISLASPRGNSMSGMDAYLPSATCLGDILKERGYRLAYYGGADLAFAGKGTFFRSHGFDEIYGLQELLPRVKPISYRTSWGLYDDSLFGITYKRFLELSKSQDPFALFMLTLDTHQSDPHTSKTCERLPYGDGSDAMLNAVACSDRLITEFVDKIIASPHGKNTTVVVASDHLALNNSAREQLEQGERRNRLMIISPDVTAGAPRSELGSTLDTGSTILPFLGYRGDIGLGRDLLNPEQSISEIETIQSTLPEWEGSLSRFWDFPKITSDIRIDVAREKVVISDREFKTPILIELEPDLQTHLVFNRIAPDELPDTLLYNPLINRRDPEASFLLIDRCATIQGFEGRQGYCLVAGKGAAYSATPLSDSYILSIQDILRLTDV